MSTRHDMTHLQTCCHCQLTRNKNFLISDSQRLFDQYAGSSARGFVRILRSQLPSLIWDGSLKGIPVNLLNQKLGVLWSNAGQKAEQQAENYQEIVDMLTNAIEQLA